MSDARRMPLGAFASVGAGGGLPLKRVVELGFPTAQVFAPPTRQCTQECALEWREMFRKVGVEVTLVFCGFDGEKYDTIPVVRDTVGLVPESTRAERVARARRIAQFAADIGAPGIGIHVGFIPEKWASKAFTSALDAVARVADTCAELGLRMHMETGQETASTLYHVLEVLDRKTLAVNFDPANMILYGSGDPIDALHMVGQWVHSVHCKDATWSSRPGIDWGREVRLGEGDVNMELFIATLAEVGYTGPLTIEREVGGEQQFEDMKAAIVLLNDIKGRLGLVG